MKNAELKEAVSKYIESKELVLMGYSPEYIDDVKNDMEVAFRAGAEWMAGQGGSFENKVFSLNGRPMLDGLAKDCVLALEKAGAKSGDKVIVQIRKKQ